MKRVFATIFLCSILSGCSGVGSVYPIYTEKDAVFLPELLGTWVGSEGEKDVVGAEGGMVISRGEGNSYKLGFWESEGKESKMVTVNFQLTKIGNTLFADVFSEKCEISDDMGFAMPVHLFAKVELKDSKLQIGWPDVEWFNKYLDKHRRATEYLRYEKKNDGYRYIYLTGNTKHVRSFLKKAAKFPEAFPPMTDGALVKVSESQTLSPPPTKAGTKPDDCSQNPPQEHALK